jgi:hypothetical protein
MMDAFPSPDFDTGELRPVLKSFAELLHFELAELKARKERKKAARATKEGET